MTEQPYPIASTFGFGLMITDGKIGVVIILGDTDDNSGDATTHAGIVLTPEVADFFVARLGALLHDIDMAEEAVKMMGEEAATEYLQNWSKRVNSGLN